MSWTSPFTVAITSRPFVELPPTFSMCGSRYATAAFIVSALCRTNGSCIWPLPNSSPTTRIPSSRTSLTIASGAMPAVIASSSSAVSPSRSPSMIRCLSRASTGPAAAVLLDGLDALDVGEDLQEGLQRVVAVAAAVVDQVEAHVALLVGQLVERHDLAGVDDGRVEAVLLALVEEHAVQRVAAGRGESEADVAQPEHGERPGDLLLDPPDRVHRRHRVLAQVLVAGGQRERQGVEDQVVGRQAVALRGDLVDAVGHLHLPLDVAGLAALVDQQADRPRRRSRGPARRHGPCGCRAARRPRGWPS